jgi:multidrug efflux pump subunit AcrA (membrane-fusion protein)
LEAGATIREGQVLIRLPDPTKMQIKATVNESRISLIQPGMPVEVAVDAARDRKLAGSVVKVNQYAEPGSWSSGNIQEYAAFIDIHDPPPEIRTGMNAEVRIFVERLSDALQVPVQALCEVKGHYFCLVHSGERFETREVQVGSSNDTYMTIKSGLQEGEVVVLNPRGFPDKLTLPEVLEEKAVAVKIRPPRPPLPDGEEKPKVRPPDDQPGPRPAAPGGAP